MDDLFISDFIQFKIWKGAVLIALACIYGFWRGFTGRSRQARRDKHPE